MPLGLSEVHIPGEQLPHGRSEESVETIRTEGQQHEQYSKDENLPGYCPSGGLVFDDQTFGDLGNNVRLQSSGFDPTAPYYDIEVASSASMVTITSGLTQKTSSPPTYG